MSSWMEVEDDVPIHLWNAMYDDKFITGDEDNESLEALEALYPAIHAALARRKKWVTLDAIYEIAQEVTRGQSLPPEFQARVIFAVEWHARQMSYLREYRPAPVWQPFRRGGPLATSWYDDGEEPPRVPGLTSVFPSLEEVEDALHLDTPSITTYNIYRIIADLYRTFGVFPDFPTLIERLRQNPVMLHEQYARIWYIWRATADLHHLIRDRMQRVRDAAR